MIREHLSLVEILDMNQFQSIQDNLSVSTDLALLTVDYKGIPVDDFDFSGQHGCI